MTLSNEQLLQLLELAKSTAKQAGLLVNSYLDKEVMVTNKADASSLCTSVLTEVDIKAEKLIIKKLADSQKKYDLGLLTEEQQDDHSRLQKDYFWCIDPIDGTLAFTQKQAGFCVSIALVNQQGEAILAAIYDAFAKDLYYAGRHLGAYKNGQPLKINKHNSEYLQLISDHSFSQFDYCPQVETHLQQLAKQYSLGYQSQFQGGSVMNALWVLQAPMACFFKFPKSTDGGGCIWDFAASCCIAQELGRPITDIYGAPLQLNRAESVFMNHNGVIVSSQSQLGQSITDMYAQLNIKHKQAPLP